MMLSHQHMYFFLVQSEQGDIFKITLDTDDDMVCVCVCVCVCVRAHYGLYCQVIRIRIKYFDTVPVCASICVLRRGLLFCASEFGNQ